VAIDSAVVVATVAAAIQVYTMIAGWRIVVTCKLIEWKFTTMLAATGIKHIRSNNLFGHGKKKTALNCGGRTGSSSKKDN